VTGSDEPEVPKVTPYLLRRATDLCARRLACEIDPDATRSTDPFLRARVRDAFRDAAIAAQLEGGHPKPSAFTWPRELEPEERAVLDQAARWYLRFYGDREATIDTPPVEDATVLPRRGVALGGWIDLTLVGRGYRREVRQVQLWGGPEPGADPLAAPALRVGLLRLAQVRWLTDEPVLVSWCDPVHGILRERLVEPRHELAELGAWLDERLGVLRTRIATPTASPGDDCGGCRYVPRCPAHDVLGGMFGGRVPGVVALTPTSYERWTRCVRQWRNRHLLSLPPSDPTTPSEHGPRLHALLRLLHEEGSCADPDHVRDVVDRHGGDERTCREIGRHAQRCPSAAAESVGHERALARAHGRPTPVFIATARFDALWAHDGVLDVRDYKTGRLWYSDLADDPRARVQAWVAAPLARERGLRLRLRYEHLSEDIVEDPEAWEPDEEQLDAIGRELRRAVEAMHAERQWRGAHDETSCVQCDYRSICPDSAAASVAQWPAVDDESDDPAARLGEPVS
jgi:hypothetical protein